MSVSTLRQRLLTKLNAMQTLKGVWDWETSNVEGKYPFATLTLRDGEGSFESTFHNLRRRGFRIRIYQERAKLGQGPENAEDISTSVIDELETALDMDTTLSGTCKYVKPAGWVAGYQDRELDVRILEINIDAYELSESK